MANEVEKSQDFEDKLDEIIELLQEFFEGLGSG